MLLSKNNRIVENILKQRLHTDRAKIQVGALSSFGLLEMSRQRLRPSIYEADFITCHHCLGLGRIRSLESLTLKALHQIEEKATNFNEKSLIINFPEKTAIHILNNKRKELSNIEEKRKIKITIIPDDKLQDEENPLEKIKSINKNNNDNKANFYNKNKKDLHNKIKRPIANNRYKKKNPVQNLKNKEEDNIKNNNINSKGSSVEEKKENIKNNAPFQKNKKVINNTNIIKDVNKPHLKPKKSSNNKPKSNFNNSDNIVSSSSKTNKVKDDAKPIAKTKIKKQIIKTVKTKRKGPAKKGWWNKE